MNEDVIILINNYEKVNLEPNLAEICEPNNNIIL